MVEKLKAAVLFTGGKDSCLASHLAKKEGYKIKYLLSILPENFDSFMFHKPSLTLLKKQAEMLGIKLIINKSKGEKEKEIEDLKKLISKVKNKIDTIIAGGIASNYQGKRIKEICNELKLKFYAPLWNYKEDKIWQKLLEEGFKVVLIKISCEGIPREFLGKIIDKKRFAELRKFSEKYKFRLDFEGGEAETAVLFMPEFKKDIRLEYCIKSEGEYRHYLDVMEVK